MACSKETHVSNCSDLIREFANVHFIEPARKARKRQVTVRAGDVHSKMLLRSRMPQVCGALGASLFESACRVKLIQRDGPHNVGIYT